MLSRRSADTPLGEPNAATPPNVEDYMRRQNRGLAVGAVAGLAALGGAYWACAQVPGAAASALLNPTRRPVREAAPDGCSERAFDGAGVTLRGWHCQAAGPARGSVVLLHGIADNRASWRGAIDRFARRGFNVVAYDSRAHGESDGDACTYGFYEKEDLRRLIDGLARGPIALVGTSLGAAVALQEAAEDPRIRVVVAAETFANLRSIATERAPFFLTASAIAEGFAVAERRARFAVERVSPERAAERIRAPVLVIHGDRDVETRPSHSQQVYARLAGPKRLLLVDGAGHNESLARADVWDAVESWIATNLTTAEPR